MDFLIKPAGARPLVGRPYSITAKVQGETQNLQQTLVHNTTGGSGDIYVDKTNGWVYHGYGISNVAKCDRSKDGGQTWTNIYSSSSYKQVRSIWAEGDFILIGTGGTTGHASVQKSTTSTPSFTTTWNATFSTGSESIFSIQRFANGSFVISYGDGGGRVLVGDASGGNFVVKRTYPYSLADTTTITTAYIIAVDGNSAICTLYHFYHTSSQNAKIIHSEDAGETWVEYSFGNIGATIKCCFSLGYWWITTRKAATPMGQVSLHKVPTNFSTTTLVQADIGDAFYGLVGLVPTSQGVAMSYPEKVEHFGDWRNTTTLTLGGQAVLSADIYGKKVYASTGFATGQADVFSFYPQSYTSFNLKQGSTVRDTQTKTDSTYSFTDTGDLSDTGTWTLEATNGGTTITSDPFTIAPIDIQQHGNY